MTRLLCMRLGTGLSGATLERVVAVACNAILDRAFGKPREHHEREVDQFDRMSPEELEEHIAKQMTAWGWVKLAAVEGTDD